MNLHQHPTPRGRFVPRIASRGTGDLRPADPFTPGSYLRRRREAGYLSIETAAWRLATQPELLAPGDPVTVSAVDRLAAFLDACERDTNVLDDGVATVYARIVPLDVAVYELLRLRADDPRHAFALPLPQLCRVCACSYLTPCRDRHAGYCAWVADDATLCTTCAARAPDGGGERAGQRATGGIAS